MAGLDDLISEDGSLGAPKLSAAVGKMPNAEIMADARTALSGNWGMGVLGYFLYTILLSSISMMSVSGMFLVEALSIRNGSDPEVAVALMQFMTNTVLLLISGPAIVGFVSFFLGITQNGEARLELLFTGFKRFWKSFGVYFLTTFFIFMWTLLFIIPGIIAAFRYSMAFFIIADDPECGPMEAIFRSKQIMSGNKWKFFCLNLRFIGWMLLASMFTFGIGYLWLVPYMQTSQAKFYENVK